MYRLLISLTLTGVLLSCNSRVETAASGIAGDSLLATPALVTEPVKFDSDDPAIWINMKDPSQSMIIGTDKGGDSGDGALYAFDMNGRIIESRTVRGIQRPNNVDIAYQFSLGDTLVDIAVCTERNTNSIRVFSLPDMKSIDNGGIPVFESDSLRLPMGVALYTSAEGRTYAIVSRKTGPESGYLWQYELSGTTEGVTGKVVRKFGNYSGRNEIESIAVDNELGYVYYSDESFGIRKYYAHPDSSNQELALFATTGFTDDHEGISIYKADAKSGYIIISDQQANQFHVFRREGTASNPHQHDLVRVIKAATIGSDGNEITSVTLPGFPGGLFVAMSDDQTFQFYRADEFFEGLRVPTEK